MEFTTTSDPTDLEGRICAVLLDSDATLKRVRFEARSGRRRLVLAADNARDYPPVIPQEGEEVRIIGVMIGILWREV